LSTGAILTLFQGTAVLIFPSRYGCLAYTEIATVHGWCFLEFDRSYLREHLLPELVARHFVGARTQAAIVARDPLSLIYALEPTVTIESLAQVTGALSCWTQIFRRIFRDTPPLADQQPIVWARPERCSARDRR